MTIKRGDKVGIGPAHVTWMADDHPEDCDPSLTLKHYGVNANQDELYPWHPALPKLAALLAEHGDALAAATGEVEMIEIVQLTDEDEGKLCEAVGESLNRHIDLQDARADWIDELCIEVLHDVLAAIDARGYALVRRTHD